MEYTVKEVAELAGVSVRTLHHYDQIGLLQPARQANSGYRLYTREDLERLQQILFFRELGFGLRDIKAALDRPDFDRRQALRDHRCLLLRQRERIERLLHVVDETLAALEGGRTMDVKAMFDGFDPSQYEEEVRQRWGHTRAYAEAAARTQGYTARDWEEIKTEGARITEGLAKLMDRSPADPEVQEWVSRHHRLINERFYTCPPEMYRGLGEMYVQDERFAANYEKVKPGLAQFVRAAVYAYCDRLEHEQG